jgi:TubC N-terminal docking domain
MTVWELLSETRRLAIVLHMEGNQLRVRAPKGALTPGLLEAIAARKAELLRLLASGRLKEPPPADEIGAPCPDCGATEKWWWIDGTRLCRAGVIADDHLGRSWPSAGLMSSDSPELGSDRINSSEPNGMPSAAAPAARCGWCGVTEGLEAFSLGRVYCMNCHAVWNPATHIWHPGEQAKARQHAPEEDGPTR